MLVGQPQLGFSITSPFKQAARAVRHTILKPAEMTVRATRAMTPFPLPGHARHARRRRMHHPGWSGSDDALGFSITSPFKKVAGAVKSGVKTGVKYTIVKPTQLTYKAGKAAVKYTVVAPTKWSAKMLKELTLLPLKPVRTRVQRLTSRRAAKLAWDRRKSKTPTPAENAEAKAWTKSYLMKKLPHGPALAALAGTSGHYYPYPGMSGDGLGIAPAVVAAAVPVLLAVISVVLQQASKSGEAPAQPGESPLPPPGAEGGAPGMPGAAPGEVDLAPVQDAAEAAAEQGAEAMQQVAAQAGGRQRVGGMTLPKGVSKNHLLLGGAILGGVLLIAMLKPKDGGGGGGSSKSKN